MAVKQVIVVRNDLGMRKGKMIAQGAHASMKVLLDRMKWGFADRSGDAGYEFTYDGFGSPAYLLIPDKAMQAWLGGSFTKITVQADSEAQLRELADKAKAAGLPVAEIVDAGATEFKGVPTFTSIAIGPAEASDIDPITGSLKLL